jgi:hypothetical protein
MRPELSDEEFEILRPAFLRFRRQMVANSRRGVVS